MDSRTRQVREWAQINSETVVREKSIAGQHVFFLKHYWNTGRNLMVDWIDGSSILGCKAKTETSSEPRPEDEESRR